MASAEIHSFRAISGTQPVIKRPLEAAGNTFVRGVPVQITQAGPSNGFLQEWDGVTVAGLIAGFSLISGSNLVTKGVPKFITFDSVPNQASAVKIAQGSPVFDGKLGIETSDAGTVFFGQCGPAQLVAQTDVGKTFGMTKDTDNHWFIDRTKVGASAVVQITDIDANVNTISPDVRGFYFTVLPSAAQLVP